MKVTEIIIVESDNGISRKHSIPIGNNPSGDIKLEFLWNIERELLTISIGYDSEKVKLINQMRSLFK